MICDLLLFFWHTEKWSLYFLCNFSSFTITIIYIIYFLIFCQNQVSKIDHCLKVYVIPLWNSLAEPPSRRISFSKEVKRAFYTLWPISDNFVRKLSCKVHIFWEGHKILRNLQQLFVLCTASQIIGGDFAKFCGLLRIYEL